MTITLYLQKETLMRDLKTLTHIFQYDNKGVENLRKYYEPLNISSSEFTRDNMIIQVTLEEFTLIGIFNGGI